MYPNVLQSICEFVSKSLLFRTFPNCQATPLSLQKVTLELVSTDLPATHGQHVMTTYKDRQAGKPYSLHCDGFNSLRSQKQRLWDPLAFQNPPTLARAAPGTSFGVNHFLFRNYFKDCHGPRRPQLCFLFSRPAVGRTEKYQTVQSLRSVQALQASGWRHCQLNKPLGQEGVNLFFLLSRPAVWQPGKAPNSPSPPSFVGFRAPVLSKTVIAFGYAANPKLRRPLPVSKPLGQEGHQN